MSGLQISRSQLPAQNSGFLIVLHPALQIEDFDIHYIPSYGSPEPVVAYAIPGERSRGSAQLLLHQVPHQAARSIIYGDAGIIAGSTLY